MTPRFVVGTAKWKVGSGLPWRPGLEFSLAVWGHHLDPALGKAHTPGQQSPQA